MSPNPRFLEYLSRFLEPHGAPRQLTVESRWSLVRDEQGQPSSFLVINTDITEKKQLEAKFLRAQRMESIGTLAGGIAHDLNNILHPITLALDILRTQMGEAQDGSLLELVADNSRRATALVKQVLCFAHGGEGERVPLPPKALAEEVGRIVRATFPKSIDFQLCREADIWSILGDTTQIHQVLLNLCVNARDAMPTGGELTLAVGNAEIDALQAATEPGAAAGRYVVFTVTDTGTGIPENLRERIFEPFFTTKGQGNGTGLGLATTLGIVRNHGGFVSLTSEEGKGAAFRVFIPSAESESVHEESAGGIDNADLRGDGELILVVDDEKPVRTAMRLVLEGAGYRVFCAHDGAAAIKLYAQHRDQFSAVITDVNMPLMDGMALVDAVKELEPSARVIVTTGMASPASIERITCLGIECLLPKPCASRTLLRALKETLCGSSADSIPTPAAAAPASSPF